MLISKKHKFIFFKPMKCAGSSIESGLYNYCGANDLCSGGLTVDNVIEYKQMGDIRFGQHRDPEHFFRISKLIDHYKKLDFSDYRKITVIRNPWDQMISFYWWYTNNKLEIDVSKELIINENDNRGEVVKKFKGFLNTVYQTKINNDHGKNLIIEELANKNQKFIHSSITDYLMFENLKSDYQKLIIDMNLSANPKKLKKFKSKIRKLKYHYSFYYDDQSKKQVSKAYKKTIDKFNYRYIEE